MEHLALEARVGPMDAAVEVAPRLSRLRGNVARLLNASPDEVAFMSSGSAAFGAVFAALPPLRAGDRILVGRQEWGGNVVTYERAARRAGASLEVIPCRKDGSVDPEALALMLDDRVQLVSLTWLPANGGLINDAAAVGRVTRAARVPFLLDAGQALGQLPADVQSLQCDVLVSTARKHLRGPRGTALLYVRSSFAERLDPVWMDVQSVSLTGDSPARLIGARHFESNEVSTALWMGLAESIDLASHIGIDVIASRVQQLAEYCRSRLGTLPGLKLHDLGDSKRSALVAFTVSGVDAGAMKMGLAKQGIRIGANGVPYTPFDMQARRLDMVARASFSYLNSEEDVDCLVRALRM